MSLNYLHVTKLIKRVISLHSPQKHITRIEVVVVTATYIITTDKSVEHFQFFVVHRSISSIDDSIFSSRII